MSKVICDVCGTTYPDTAAQCPICNSANRAQNQTVAGGEETVAGSYEHTRGGKFSKQNVKRRNSRPAAAEPKRRPSSKPHADEGGEEEPSSTGLIIVVILLLVAIVSVLIYIGVHYFRDNTEVPDETKGNSVYETEPDLTEPDDSVPCTGITLNQPTVELTAAESTFTLVFGLEPLGTTDELLITSSDPTVATVSADGVITAVGPGQAIITIRCGEQEATCIVNCTFGQDDPVKPTDPKVEINFAWNTRYVDSSTGYGDTTLTKAGATWRAYKTSLNVNPAEILWTSDDPNVCVIVNGIVTAVNPGRTLIHAQYDGVTYTAIVRCNWKVEVPTDPTDPTPTDPVDPSEPVAPTDPVDPSEPIVPTDPVDPSEPIAPTDPADPSEPTPTDPEASEPAPTEPTPTEPTPSEPAITYSISNEDVTLWTNGAPQDLFFYLKLVDSNGNTVDVVWTADGDGVAIEGNKITAVRAGTYNVSTTHEGVTYTCIVRVYTKTAE